MTDLIKRDPFFNKLAVWPRWFDDFDDNFQKGLKIRETANDIIVEAVVAGIPAKNVDVDIEDGVLVIKAEDKKKNETDTEFHSSSYKYYYSTALSGGQWDKAKAQVKHGIVFITIPKAESARPQKITVEEAKE